MDLTEYIVLFLFVAILGAGLPGPGDASLIAAGTLSRVGHSPARRPQPVTRIHSSQYSVAGGSRITRPG